MMNNKLSEDEINTIITCVQMVLYRTYEGTIKEKLMKIKRKLEGINMIDEEKDTCPECGSEELIHYQERICVYDKNGILIKYKDWTDYPFCGTECEDCGWTSF